METQLIISNSNPNFKNHPFSESIPFKSITNEIYIKNKINHANSNNKNPQNLKTNDEESKNCPNKQNELIIIDKNPICDNSDFIDNLTLNDVEEDLNSTFLFTGENENGNEICEAGKILSQYLQTNENEPIENIVHSKTISFSMNSDSSDKKNSYRKKREANYKKMMKLLKDQNPVKNKNDKKYGDKVQHNKILVRKNKYGKKVYFIILFALNAILYVFCLINFCEPPVSKLFFDDDHADFVYKRKKLSDDKSITIS